MCVKTMKVSNGELAKAKQLIKGSELKDVHIKSEIMGYELGHMCPVIIKKDGCNPVCGTRIHVIVGFAECFYVAKCFSS